MKELLKELKEDLLNNPTDYPLWDMFNDESKQKRFTTSSSGKMKCVNPSYTKSVNILIKELKDNIKDYIQFDWDKIEEKYKDII